MKKLLIVSNRLPIKVGSDGNNYIINRSEGGLATGLSSLNNEMETEWVGWPGIATTTKKEEREVSEKMGDSYHAVFMSRSEVKNYYQGFSNETIWPLFHCFTGFVDYDKAYWESYKKVNQRFCDKVAEVASEGDIIWVQDYHLMLLPEMLRQRLPNNPIGFFLHIPFPSYELFRTLPWRNEILEGLLGADLVGFHTYEYMRHFASVVSRILSHKCNLGEIRTRTHSCFIDAFPMGINYDKFHNSSQDQAVNGQIREFKARFGGFRLILSVDRLDYTKGILERLRAFGALFSKYPELKEKVSLVMVTVPSRYNVESYKNLKEQIDEQVGHINGKFSTLSWTPVHYFYRSIPFEHLTALYNLSDIGLVTPLRDGMNLVAKEYIASKQNQRGVLILSELAGSASELTDAIMVNPNNEEDIVAALYDALNMPEDEQKRRIEKMQAHIKKNSVEKWAQDFTGSLCAIADKRHQRARSIINGQVTKTIAAAFTRARKPRIILGYDGTLVPFDENPAMAEPTPDILRIIEELQQKCDLIITSGRDFSSLEQWFGKTGADLVAEHGIWFKTNNEWYKHAEMDTSWKDEVDSLLQQFILKTPGSFIENKTCSLAFHYRKTNQFLAEMHIPYIIKALSAVCVKHRLELLQGNKVLEVRISGISKATTVRSLLNNDQHDFLMAIGDDDTDEDVFGVLPSHAYTIKVGDDESIARYRIENELKVKSLLNELIKVKKQRKSPGQKSGVLTH
ncbi:MAG: bifunctional alpha,alpha-trehalose-phosphate synthase (UDP-forming)/trehalose-phosphatase [Bacteroidia bacterium]